MIAQGLTPQQALRAVTLTPAELMGVSNRLGTIEAGKIANLTITSGDLFASGTAIRWVFVDGKPTEVTPPATRVLAGAQQPSASGAAMAAGTWSLTITIGANNNLSTLRLVQEGERLTGSIESVLGRNTISEGRVNSSGDVHFKVNQSAGTQVFEGIFDGKITGNTMSGLVQISGAGAAPFVGTRPPVSSHAPVEGAAHTAEGATHTAEGAAHRASLPAPQLPQRRGAP
jgi:hypothetical protein